MSFAAAQRKGRDVHPKLTQSRTNLADDAGLVTISEIQKCAFELRLHRDAADLEHSGGAVVEDGAFGSEFRNAIGSGFTLFGKSGYLQGVRKAVFAAARLLFYCQAAGS